MSLGCFFWDDLTAFVSYGKQCGLARSLFKIKRSVAFIISCYEVFKSYYRKHRNMKIGDRNRKTLFLKDFNQTRFRQTEDVAWNLIFLSSEKICSSEFEMPSELQRFKTLLNFALSKFIFICWESRFENLDFKVQLKISSREYVKCCF